MKIGTRTIIFGVHQFLIHPVIVLYAWLLLYRKFPKLYELVAIFIHDLGYIGKPNLDGPEGEQHPLVVHNFIWRNLITSKVANRWNDFWESVACEVLGHSRFHAVKYNLPISKLCRADKLAVSCYPVFLYLLLGTLSGEIDEYMARVKEGKYKGKLKNSDDKIKWLLEVRSHMTLQALEEDNGKLIEWIEQK